MSRGLVDKSTGERKPSAPGYIVDKVGDLSALHTTAKDKAVSAINEVADAVSAIDDGASIDSFADVENALADKTDTDMVAADFDSTASYTAGNYCIYEGKFYKFKASHSGAWSAADVDEIKIAGELSTLKSGLTNVDVALSVPEGTGKNLAFKMISKATINESGVIETNNAYNLFVAKVSNGETYTATKGGDYRVYAFYSTEPIVGSTSYDGSRVVESNTSNTFTFTAPTNGYIAFRSLVAYTEGQLEKGSTATAYTPYIPSVESRIEAVEERKTKWFAIEVPANATEYDYSSDAPAGAEIISVLPTGGAGLTVVQCHLGQKKIYFASAPTSKAYARVYYY